MKKYIKYPKMIFRRAFCVFLINSIFSLNAFAAVYDVLPSALDAGHTGEATIAELATNSGGSPTWSAVSDGWMFVDKGQILSISSFDIAGHTEPITGVQLMVKYSVESGYTGTNYLQYNNGTLTNTSTQPVDGESNIEDVFDLYAAGVDTWTEIAALHLYYSNNDPANPADGVSFDYIWIRVTFSCTPPSAPTAANQTICFGQSTPDLTATGSNIKWYSDPGLSVLVHSGSPYSTGITASGTYTYYVTQTISCESPSTTVVLTINSLPSPTASNSGAGCEGGSITLTGGPGGMTNYSWSGPSSFTSSSQNPTVSTNATTAMAGTYTITVTNSNGCTASTSTSVTVNTNPVATASSNSPVNEGSSLTLTGGPGAMTSYAWSGPNSFSSSSQNPTVSSIATPAMAGIYTITVTNSNGCTGNASVPVTVNPVINVTGINVAGNITVNNSIIEQTSDPGYINMSGSSKHIDGTGTFNQIKLRVTGTISFDGVISSGIFMKTLVDASKIYTIINGRTFKNVEFINNGTTTLQPTSVFENSGDWTNNATVTADMTSTVKFNGSAAQDVKSGGSDYGNVEIVNTVTPSIVDGIVLSDDMPVAATLTFTDGTIITGSNKVTISDIENTRVTFGGSNSNYTESWIYGNIRRYIKNAVNGNYVFPVGKDIKSYIAVLNNNSLPSSTPFYIDCFFKPAPTTPNLNFPSALTECNATYTNVMTEGVWSLTENGSIDGTYDLKLYFNDFSLVTVTDDNRFNIISRPTDLNDGTNWILSSGICDPTLVSSGYASRITMNTFSEKGIAKANGILPVELLSFNATCQVDKIFVNWATASEANNDYFTLEKSSDGNDFLPIYTISGAGNSNSLLNYSYTDNSPYSITYYKLRQTDFDGQYTYSDIISETCDDENSGLDIIHISGNDSGSSCLSVTYTSSQDEISFVIYDLVGQEIYSTRKISDAGQNTAVIDTRNISEGIYIILMKNKTNFVSRKVIIRK